MNTSPEDEQENPTTAEVTVEDEEGYRKYLIKAYKGDINISINAGRGAVVNVNAGQAPPPPRPPHG